MAERQVETGRKKKKKQQSGTGRGRSKKRKSSKEPFGHIASQLIPAAAFATAIPKSANVLSRSRSPSPLARAIVFASRIGQAVAAGSVLTRSLSEQQLSSAHKQQTEFALTKSISRSNPGPSGTQEPLQDVSDIEEPEYESVRDVRGLPWSRRKRSDDERESPVDLRPPMPLPDQDITDGKASAVEDLYAKVKKHTTLRSDTEKVKEIPNYDSDDITSVSEIDEELSSKIGPARRNSKGSRTKKSNELQIEEISDGPSEGEIYKLPYDHVVVNEKSGGFQFETIEEFDEDNLSARSKKTSPFYSQIGSPRDTGNMLKMERKHSSQSIRSDSDKMSSRPQTPREMGKEAALCRLEELGFDGMSKEMGMYSSLNFNKDRDFEQLVQSRGILMSEATPIPDYDVPVARETISEYVSPVTEGAHRVSTIRKRFEMENSLSGPKNFNMVVEEPVMAAENALQQYSSEELKLGDLVSDEHDIETDWKPNSMISTTAKEVVESDRKAEKRGNEAKKHADEASKHGYEASKHEDEAGKHVDDGKKRNLVSTYTTPHSQENFDVTKMMMITEEELKRQGDIQRVVLDNQAKIQEQMNGLYQSMSKASRNSSDIDHSAQIQQQLKVQHEMEKRQERILMTISDLESQMKKIATSSVDDSRQQNAREKELIELRKMILDEQKKYNDQQKLVDEQQQKILKSQKSYSQKPKKSPRYSDHSTKSSPPRITSTSSPRAHYTEHHLQFSLLESRLKAVEAERQALMDLNASMQEENDALKKISFHYDDAGSSELIYKKQNQDLLETNKHLKNLVHRLNIELSRFQAKYRPPRKEEVEGLSLPEEGSIPQWLINTKYLSPLILAYDDRLKDKNELIRAYESQLASFKTRILEIVRENQKLHLLNNEKNDDKDIIAIDEWNLLQEQARLVVEENSILMQEIDLKDRRIEEMQKDYSAEAMRLTKQIRIFENERNNLQRNISDLQYENESLKKKYEDALNESKNKINETEFQAAVQDTKRVLTSEIEFLKKDNESNVMQLQAICKEKQHLAIKLTDETAKNSTLQIELDLTSKALRKLEKKILVFQRQVNIAREKEQIATETLTQVLSVAEKSAQDRDELAKLIQSQNEKQKIDFQAKKDNDTKLDVLQNSLKKYKKLSKLKEAEMTERMAEKETEIINMKNSYESEISNLKEIIRERQRMLDLVQSHERQFENEIDNMWKSVQAENEQMKKSI